MDQDGGGEQINRILVNEIERSLYDYQWSWEGKPETVIDFGDAVYRTAYSYVLKLNLDPLTVEERLDELIPRIEGGMTHPLWASGPTSPYWVIGPSSLPDDLGTRLEARGYRMTHRIYGLVYSSLRDIPAPSIDLRLEQLSWENVQEYAVRCSSLKMQAEQAAFLETAKAYLANDWKRVSIWLARAEGQVAGYVVFRVNQSGFALIQGDGLVEGFRNRATYSSLIASALNLAQKGECIAVVNYVRMENAREELVKMGFVPVTSFSCYKHPYRWLVSARDSG